MALMLPELLLVLHMALRKILRLFLYECFHALAVVQHLVSSPALTGWSVITQPEFLQ